MRIQFLYQTLILNGILALELKDCIQEIEFINLPDINDLQKNNYVEKLLYDLNENFNIPKQELKKTENSIFILIEYEILNFNDIIFYFKSILDQIIDYDELFLTSDYVKTYEDVIKSTKIPDILFNHFFYKKKDFYRQKMNDESFLSKKHFISDIKMNAIFERYQIEPDKNDWFAKITFLDNFCKSEYDFNITKKLFQLLMKSFNNKNCIFYSIYFKNNERNDFLDFLFKKKKEISNITKSIKLIKINHTGPMFEIHAVNFALSNWLYIMNLDLEFNDKSFQDEFMIHNNVHSKSSVFYDVFIRNLHSDKLILNTEIPLPHFKLSNCNCYQIDIRSLDHNYKIIILAYNILENEKICYMFFLLIDNNVNCEFLFEYIYEDDYLKQIKLKTFFDCIEHTANLNFYQGFDLFHYPAFYFSDLQKNSHYFHNLPNKCFKIKINRDDIKYLFSNWCNELKKYFTILYADYEIDSLFLNTYFTSDKWKYYDIKKSIKIVKWINLDENYDEILNRHEEKPIILKIIFDFNNRNTSNLVLLKLYEYDDFSTLNRRSCFHSSAEEEFNKLITSQLAILHQKWQAILKDKNFVLFYKQFQKLLDNENSFLKMPTIKEFKIYFLHEILYFLYNKCIYNYDLNRPILLKKHDNFNIKYKKGLLDMYYSISTLKFYNKYFWDQYKFTDQTKTTVDLMFDFITDLNDKYTKMDINKTVNFTIIISDSALYNIYNQTDKIVKITEKFFTLLDHLEFF
ncbi:hypothetical protein GVAV_000737 [Gurleya vavrai]